MVIFFQKVNPPWNVQKCNKKVDILGWRIFSRILSDISRILTKKIWTHWSRGSIGVGIRLDKERRQAAPFYTRGKIGSRDSWAPEAKRPEASRSNFAVPRPVWVTFSHGGENSAVPRLPCSTTTTRRRGGGKSGLAARSAIRIRTDGPLGDELRPGHARGEHTRRPSGTTWGRRVTHEDVPRTHGGREVKVGLSIASFPLLVAKKIPIVNCTH